jgi:RNA polymerase sigma factor (sigma-70 family)
MKDEANFREHQQSRNEEQIEEWYPKLHRYCQFISQNKWDGEDLAQESFLKAWMHYKHQPQVSTALVNKIAHNQWIDTIRKRKKESLENIPEDVHHEIDPIINRYEVIQLVLTKLTPKQAVMLVLKEGFQYQITEIAEVLDTSESAVKAAIFRAKQRMAKADDINPLIDQYWGQNDREELEQILHESFRTQDPSIIIQSIPNIHSLRKELNPSCSMRKSPLYQVPSNTFLMAA